MKAETNKLRDELRRYWYLLSQINDPKASVILRGLIAEIEARLEATDGPNQPSSLVARRGGGAPPLGR